MSNQVQIPYYEIANTIYIIIRDEDSKVWNTSSKIFEVWDDLNIADYVVNSTYKEYYLYAAVFPADISRGHYAAMIFLQSGGSPNISNDIWIGNASYYWDGADLFADRVETLVEYSAGLRFTEKALEEGADGGDGVVVKTIERAPKTQIEASEVVDAEDVPVDVEVLPAGVQRTSAARAGTLTRGSSSRIGP